jgi:DnaJ family protein B protein 12
MESNKDESEKCIKIAVDCIKSGDNEKALRFLHKAQRLYPTPRAEGNIHSYHYFLTLRYILISRF